MQKKEDLTDLDVAFVEGAITHPEQEVKLKKIRAISKKLVAIGSCAGSGFPSGQRNLFDPEKQAEIEALLTRFAYAEKVNKLSDLVKVDYQVLGCPMDETAFLELLNQLLADFGIVEFSTKSPGKD